MPTNLFKQEKWMEEVSVALHSLLKSKIHAIDLALYDLKKYVQENRAKQNIKSISDATTTSLSIIDDLGSVLSNPTLYTFGFIAAIEELASAEGLKIKIDTLDKDVPFPLSYLAAASLYRMIESWVAESKTRYKSEEIGLDVYWTEDNWRILYKDNGHYDGVEKEKDIFQAYRLNLIQARIHLVASSESGRSIILTGSV